jgi:hypothetical protein
MPARVIVAEREAQAVIMQRDDRADNCGGGAGGYRHRAVARDGQLR